MLVNADFHIHSCFSMASSKDMVIRNMAPKSKLKGLQLLGTGDAFHPKWLDIIEESTDYLGDGIYSSEGMDFVLTTEVEAKHRIHHVIIIPDMDIALRLGLSYKGFFLNGKHLDLVADRIHLAFGR